jgi:hypothetical protein
MQKAITDFLARYIFPIYFVDYILPSHPDLRLHLALVFSKKKAFRAAFRLLDDVQDPDVKVNITLVGFQGEDIFTVTLSGWRRTNAK